MSIDVNKAPFPWAGGKRKAAATVWGLLGDPGHYVEPFAGSLAVLLERPHEANRTYYSETVNDADGLLVNAWRAIQLHPDAVADAASNPVAEADLHARHVALVRWREERELEHLMGDPVWCDPTMAGWWLWGVSCWIGGEFAHGGNGPWWPDETGRLSKWGKGEDRPGVSRQVPHLGDDGRGVNRPQLREPGVSRKRPHLSNNGQGVNRPQLREPGVSRQVPHLGDNGRGVNHAGLREPGWEPHPVTMPELTRWMRHLSARLRHVRIVNGDWSRVCTGGATRTLPVRSGKTHCGVFLDPPYSTAADRAAIYAAEDFDVADDVREWCLEHGDDPAYRIVLAGYDVEHQALEDAGWSVHEWFTDGYLTGGYGNQRKDGGTHQQKRERLWASPHCQTESDAQGSLFDEVAS